MEMLKIYQIYYKPEQTQFIQFTPYFNENCTVYFENSVISKLISESAHKSAEFFGVFGPRFKTKIEHGPGPRKNNTNYFEEFTYIDEDSDIIGMVQYEPHDPITYWTHIHPRLAEFFTHVLYRLGIEWKPTIMKDAFYSYLFIARSEIYERYVTELLNPAIAVMDGMPELMTNSGYPCPLPNALKKKWDIDHYPYHTFIAERLFSYFVHVNKFKISYY